MTVDAFHQYYHQQSEPIRSCLFALHDIILAQDHALKPEWKYGMPFFCYNGKMCCYLWVDKKRNQPYIGFVEGLQIHHPNLIQEKRARMKIWLVNAHDDLPIGELKNVFDQMLTIYRAIK